MRVPSPPGNYHLLIPGDCHLLVPIGDFFFDFALRAAFSVCLLGSVGSEGVGNGCGDDHSAQLVTGTSQQELWWNVRPSRTRTFQ
eukprot:c36511_g1_i1 orf=334-588(-)